MRLSEVSKDNEYAYSEEVDRLFSARRRCGLDHNQVLSYVHSAVSQWKNCNTTPSDSRTQCYLLFMFSWSSVCCPGGRNRRHIFHRDSQGQWDLSNYYLLDRAASPLHHQMLVQVHSKVWLGYRNRVHVIDPRLMCVESSFDAHPRKELQVGRWRGRRRGLVSIRLDSSVCTTSHPRTPTGRRHRTLRQQDAGDWEARFSRLSDHRSMVMHKTVAGNRQWSHHQCSTHLQSWQVELRQPHC